MIKRRFGEEFHAKIQENLEVKAAVVVRKNARDGKKKPQRDNKDRPERKPREQKEKKEGDKVVEEVKEEKPAAEKEAPAKR
jgi:hypothetical protein